MMRSLFSAVSGLKNHQTAMDVIGNNISNVNTTAYKSSRVMFQDIYSQTLSPAAAPVAGVTGGQNAKQVGLGMSIAAISTSITEGSKETTNGTLDFSIEGEGYFIIQTDNGTLYTRNGNFFLDAQGNLVTANGGYVLGTEATDIAGTVDPADLEIINIDPDEYLSCSVDANGIVTGVDADGNEEEIGRISLATFINAAGLEKQGNSLYSRSANSGGAVVFSAGNGTAGTLSVGSLEMSNVDLATELTNMIIMQRGFQANSRVITTSDTMLEELVNLKRS